MSGPVILSVSRDFDVPPETLFDAWLDPALAAKGNGSTLTLTHAMDPAWASCEEQTRKGWTTILDSLARTTEERS